MDNSTTPVVTSTPSFSTTAPKKKSRRGLIIVIIVAIVLGALFFIFKPFGSGSKAEPTPTVQVQPTEEPTPTEDVTPTPEEDTTPTTKPTTKPTSGPVTSAKTMHIQVLNGTGEAGVAAAGSSHLSSKGYTNIETGNADNTDAQGVTVQVKSKYSSYEDTLITDLKEKYSSVSSGSALSDDSDFDAIVTIGK